MSRLVPCPGCNRHVRDLESKCPFCARVLDVRAEPAPLLPRIGRGAIALGAIGASLLSVSSLEACKDNSLPPPVVDAEVAAPVYGAPAPFPPDSAVAPPEPPVEGNAASGGAAPIPDAPLVAGGAPPEVRHPKPVYGAPPRAVTPPSPKSK